MRTDALNCFGTALEKRFTRAEIQQMMADAASNESASPGCRPLVCGRVQEQRGRLGSPLSMRSTSDMLVTWPR
jgi:hypothetical protein